MVRCQKCGAVTNGENFCQSCGAQLNASSQPQAPQAGYPQYQPPAYASPPANANPSAQAPAGRSVAAFVVGLIGSIFGIFGGLCVAACYSGTGNDTVALLFLIGGSLLGLFGACTCMKKATNGGMMQLAGALLIAICAFGITGADFATLIGMFLLAVGGIVGLVSKK